MLGALLGACAPAGDPEVRAALAETPPEARWTLLRDGRPVGSATTRYARTGTGHAFEHRYRIELPGATGTVEVAARTRLEFDGSGTLRSVSHRSRPGSVNYRTRWVPPDGNGAAVPAAVGARAAPEAPPLPDYDLRAHLGLDLLAAVRQAPPGGTVISRPMDWNTLQRGERAWRVQRTVPGAAPPSEPPWVLLDASGRVLHYRAGAEGLSMARAGPGRATPRWLLLPPGAGSAEGTGARKPSDGRADRWLAATPRLPRDAAAVRDLLGGAGALAPDVRVPELVARTHAALRFDDGAPPRHVLDALRVGAGSCVAFAELFTALARATGLPARVRTGTAVPVTGAAPGPHAWSEVWIGGRWRAVDPAWRQWPAAPGHLPGDELARARPGPAD